MAQYALLVGYETRKLDKRRGTRDPTSFSRRLNVDGIDLMTISLSPATSKCPIMTERRLMNLSHELEHPLSLIIIQ